MTRADPYRPRRDVQPAADRPGYAANAMAEPGDKQDVSRRDDLDIEQNLDEFDEQIDTLAARVAPVAYFHGTVAGGEVTTISSSGLSVGALTAVLTLELETVREVYSVTIANQLDTTDTYRPAMRDAEAFVVSSFDVAGAPRDLSAVDSEFAVWVWAL